MTNTSSSNTPPTAKSPKRSRTRSSSVTTYPSSASPSLVGDSGSLGAISETSIPIIPAPASSSPKRSPRSPEHNIPFFAVPENPNAYIPSGSLASITRENAHSSNDFNDTTNHIQQQEALSISGNDCINTGNVNASPTLSTNTTTTTTTTTVFPTCEYSLMDQSVLHLPLTPNSETKENNHHSGTMTGNKNNDNNLFTIDTENGSSVDTIKERKKSKHHKNKTDQSKKSEAYDITNKDEANNTKVEDGDGKLNKKIRQLTLNDDENPTNDGNNEGANCGSSYAFPLSGLNITMGNDKSNNNNQSNNADVKQTTQLESSSTGVPSSSSSKKNGNKNSQKSDEETSNQQDDENTRPYSSSSSSSDNTEADRLYAFLETMRTQDMDYITQIYKNMNTVYDLERYLNTLVANKATLNFLVTPPGVAKPILWTFLHVKRMIKELGWLAIALSNDGCGKNSVGSEDDPCKVMRRGSLNTPVVLCASNHKRPQTCSAIDYAWHTLDWAMSVVNFGALDSCEPLSTITPSVSMHTLSITYKRLMAIFQHAWYFHPDVFVKFEAITNLYEQSLALGIYTKMSQNNIPLLGYQLNFKRENITGLGDDGYMRELTILLQFSTTFSSNETNSFDDYENNRIQDDHMNE